MEDSPRDAELIQRKLEIGGLACDIVLVDSKEGFASALAKARCGAFMRTKTSRTEQAGRA